MVLPLLVGEGGEATGEGQPRFSVPQMSKLHACRPDGATGQSLADRVMGSEL